MTLFLDRRDAGRHLARRLSTYARREDVIVLALPRGGVPVAYEIAEALEARLDVFVVRKLGVPGHEELAMGAIASAGVQVLDPGILARFGVSEAEIEEVTRKERSELARRERAYREDRAPLELRGRTVILVDDGLATGASMQAAVAALSSASPARVVIAVPVAPPSTARVFAGLVDEFVCLATPERFIAVGMFYEDFGETSDEEVRSLLDTAAARVSIGGPVMTASAARSSGGHDRIVRIAPQDWEDCFDRFSRSHEGWLATLTTVGAESGMQTEARDLPLGGVVPEPRMKAVSIRLGPLDHFVNHPSSVWLRVGPDGAEKALEIEAADATRTLLEFRSALPTEMVDGIVRLPVEA